MKVSTGACPLWRHEERICSLLLFGPQYGQLSLAFLTWRGIFPVSASLVPWCFPLCVSASVPSPFLLRTSVTLPQYDFFLFIYLFIYSFIFRGERKKRRRETSMCGCLSCTPYWGPGLQPRHVPWLGIKPATLCLTGQHSVHWATPVRADLFLTNNIC